MGLFAHGEEGEVWKLYPQWFLLNRFLGMEHRARANGKRAGKRSREGVKGHSSAKESDPDGELQERPRVKVMLRQRDFLHTADSGPVLRRLWSIHCRALPASGGRTSSFQGPQKWSMLPFREAISLTES